MSLENVLLDVKELQRGLELTKREYTMHDHNTMLKDFIQSNEGKLKKLQDDAKIAQVLLCSLPPRGGLCFHGMLGMGRMPGLVCRALRLGCCRMPSMML